MYFSGYLNTVIRTYEWGLDPIYFLHTYSILGYLSSAPHLEPNSIISQ